MPSKIRSAAELIAASKCSLSRHELVSIVWRSLHRKDADGQPVPCQFCTLTATDLVALIADGNRWNDHNEGRPLLDFGKLSQPEQRRRVYEAQYPSSQVDSPGQPTV